LINFCFAFKLNVFFFEKFKTSMLILILNLHLFSAIYKIKNKNSSPPCLSDAFGFSCSPSTHIKSSTSCDMQPHSPTDQCLTENTHPLYKSS